MKVTQENIYDIFKCTKKSPRVIESQGYELIEYLFCDNSGMGTSNERAYTQDGAIREIERITEEDPTVYVWIVDAGQFQVNLGVYKKTGKTTSKKIANNTYLIDDSKIILHDTIILEQDKNNIILNSGGYETATTKNRINAYLPSRYILRQVNFEWYIYDGKTEKQIPFVDNMKLTGKIEL